MAIVFAVSAGPSYGQTWLRTTPREAHDIPSTTGQWVDFNMVQIVTGMQYSVHSTGLSRTQMPGTDFADAHYYDGFLPSGLAQVGLQVKYNATQLDFLQVRAPSLYASSHDYTNSVASAGTSLSFRFFDSQEYPGTKPYYSDNSGEIRVEVAQGTPELVVQYDTLTFGDVDMRSPVTLLDSIESIGTNPFVVDESYITGSSDFSIVSGSTSSVQIGEEKAISFGVRFAPTAIGPEVAVLHLRSAAAFYRRDKDRQIVLIGIGHGPIIQVLTDTVHCGFTSPNITVRQVGHFKNIGDRGTTIDAVTFADPAFTAAPTYTLPPGGTTDITVNFTPTSPKYYLSAATLRFDNGWKSIPFYADGTAAVGQSRVAPDTLFFGQVVVGASKTLPATVINVGQSPFHVQNWSIANSLDFSATGPVSVALASGELQSYDVTFAPVLRTGAAHVGYITFYFDDGQSPKSVVLVGYDHTPISGKVRIRRNYWEFADSTVAITQELLTSVDSAADSIRHFTETIGYDPKLLDLVSTDRGALLSSDWNIAFTSLSYGQIDVVANSTGDPLHGPGDLLVLRFHVHSDAQFGDSSEFPQTSLVFGSGFEPLVTTTPGLLRIKGECSPTFMLSGTASGTGIMERSGAMIGQTGEIHYSVGRELSGAHVTLRVFSPLGELVKQLDDGAAESGERIARLNTTALPSGVYTIVLDAGGVHDRRRLILEH